jgi:nicotinate-nucleotide adenylyltransferase
LNTPRIGILGGTFDPIHTGHLHLASEVRRLFRLKEIWFLIARTPPHKTNRAITPEWHRCSMVALALQHAPAFKICDYELHSKSEFTIDTLRALSAKHRGTQLYFIAGGDALRDFSTWHKYQEILREFHMIFVRRPNVSGDATLSSSSAFASIRSHRAKDAPWDRGSFMVDVGAPNISSTQIRLADSTKMKKWVPPEVYQYIRKHRIYE